MARRLVGLGLVAALACGCGSEVSALQLGGAGGGSTGSGGATSTAATGTGMGTGTGSVTSTSTGAGGGMSMMLGCYEDPPPNAPAEAPLADASDCPMIQPGANAIGQRSVLVVVPKNVQPNEKLPVVFLWHWLGGSAQGFIDKADAQTAADYYRFIAVAMVAKGDIPDKLQWPFLKQGTPIVNCCDDSRVQEEYAYFDKTLACVAKTFNVNRHCVSSVGVSAGALWTQVLATGRSQFLSSFESLSGGEGGQYYVRNYGPAQRKIPAMVLWGGPNDACGGVFNFQDLSHNLEGKLEQNGEFILECIHNCGHSVPPFEPLPGSPTQFGVMWEFVLDHPDWIAPGTSPWQQTGLPPGYPSWCAIGAGKATPRTGPCPSPPGC